MSTRKPLPPYGREIKSMLERGERPVIFGGSIVAACTWDVAPHWPRIVIPDDPARYDLEWCHGVSWLVLAREGHDRAHVDAVVRALRDSGADVVAPVILPSFNVHA